MNTGPTLLLAGLFTAVVIASLDPRENISTQDNGGLLPWPATFEGDPLVSLPLGEKEATFSKSFPGSIARFQAGDITLILRQVTRPTRRLHPSRDCFRAAGYRVGPAREEDQWTRYSLEGKGGYWSVREQVRSMAPELQTAQRYPDIQSWHWHARLNPTSGPWLAISVLQPVPD